MAMDVAKRAGSKARWRAVWMTLAAAVLTLVLVAISVVAYWRYATWVPPAVLPEEPAPSPNGYLLAEAALRQLRPPHLEPLQRPTRRNQRDARRQLLSHGRPTLEAVRRALLHGWWRPRELPRDGFPIPFELLACAHGYAVESEMAGEAGDPDRALDCALDAMQLGAKLSHGADGDVRRIATMCHDSGYRGAPSAVAAASPTATSAALERVRGIRSEWAPLSALVENQRQHSLRAMSARFRYLQALPAGQQWDAYRLEAWEAPDPTSEALRLALSPRSRALESVSRHFRDLALEADKPPHQRNSVPVPDEPWTRAWFTGARRPGWDEQRATVELTLLEAALAVRAHRLERGGYPRRLTGIDRKWLPSVPLDLWEQPIAYRLRNGRPVIYSLGPNRRDDGGVPLDNPQSRHPSGDLVFTY